MNEKNQVTGQCLCGDVSYAISGDPVIMAQCHCRDCQRSSGTGHMSLAIFKEDDVQVTGETASYSSSADSGNINTRHFCATCGSRLFSRNSGRPGMINIAVGCTDNSDWYSPKAVLYVKNRHTWDMTSGDIPNFDGMPPPPEK